MNPSDEEIEKHPLDIEWEEHDARNKETGESFKQVLCFLEQGAEMDRTAWRNEYGSEWDDEEFDYITNFDAVADLDPATYVITVEFSVCKRDGRKFARVIYKRKSGYKSV